MIDSQSLQLHTTRLLLKDLSPDDAEALFAYRSLPEVKEFQGWSPNSTDDAKAFITNDICHILDRPDTWFQLGIFLREDKSLIGDAGLHFLAAEAEAETVEIGITIAPTHQGKGYAAEAMLRILDFLFKELNKSKVIASVDPANHKSMSLMERVGFKLEGIYPKSVFFRGEWADDAIFSLTLEQWRNRLSSNR